MAFNYYTTKIFARQCIIDIRINDIPLIREIVDSELNCERPINYLIEKTGKQMVSISILPCPSFSTITDNYELVVEIWKCNVEGQKIRRVDKVVSIVHNSEEYKSKRSSVIKKIFMAEVGYEMARWSNCQVIDGKTDIKALISSYLNKLTKILSTKQFEVYAHMIEQRERNICHSLYLGETEIQKRMDMLIECLNGGFEYVPIRGLKKLQYFGNHRVVAVVGEDLKPVIQFYRRDTEESLTMEFLFGIHEGSNDLSII